MMQGSLAEKLRVLRAQRGLSLMEAAERTGVTRDTLSELERGRRHPYTPTLSKIAKGYGVPVEDLLEEPALSGKAEASSPPRRTLQELLQEGAGTHYLALASEDLEDLYETSSFEEARAITRATMVEQKVINDFLNKHDRTDIVGRWITASQLNRWVSLEGMQKAAQREIDQAREAGNDERAEKIREAHGLAVQEIAGVY